MTATIIVASLIGDAKAELSPQHPDSYKTFLLGLFCRLRRRKWTAWNGLSLIGTTGK
jgi:hypothetical protein